MTIRPIIFSAPMVRALLEGRKTQTRRLATSPLARCVPGDLLWVREGLEGGDSGDALRYQTRHAEGTLAQRWDYVTATIPEDWGYSRAKVPSIHMPRWASRLTLEVTAVRTHRLREIVDRDARAEGFNPDPNICTPWHAFLDYWNELHGEGATDTNPEVVALTFKVHQVNVDQMARAA